MKFQRDVVNELLLLQRPARRHLHPECWTGLSDTALIGREAL